MGAEFDISDVSDLLRIERLPSGRGDGGSFNVVCPYCGDRRGKMNFCVTKDGAVKNTYHCFVCDAGGNMLTLYADMRHLSGAGRYKQAYREIRELLERSGQKAKKKCGNQKKQENTKEIFYNGRSNDSSWDNHNRYRTCYQQSMWTACEKAPADVCDKTYRKLISLLSLTKEHEEKLLARGFTYEQIYTNGFVSTCTTARDRKEVCLALLGEGCVLDGVPGFYRNERGEYDINFNYMNRGFLCPVRNRKGQTAGFQIRLDEPYDGRKYIWLTSTGREKGASSGSPVAFFGNPKAETVCVTEGPLKGLLAHQMTGLSFLCVPGVSQYKNLRKELIDCKIKGCKKVIEMYDMDKYMPVTCGQDEENHCEGCLWKECRENENIMKECPKKAEKRNNIRKGCQHLYEICRELNLPVVRQIWDMGENGLWQGNYKGIDDYLVSCKQIAVYK